MIPFADNTKTNRIPFVTYTLVGINILVFILELLSPNLDAFISTYAFTPSLFDITVISTWFPIISAAFLHGGISHIFFNMLFLWVFGDNVEDALGWFKYLLFYIGTAIAATLLQYLVDPASSIPMLGASGAVAGILGYYLIHFPHHKIKSLLFFYGRIYTQAIPAKAFLLYWAITQFFSGFGSLFSNQSEGGTAWFAHIGGLLFGVAIGLLVKVTNENKITSENYSE